MVRPSPIDFELSEGAIREIDSLIKQANSARRSWTRGAQWVLFALIFAGAAFLLKPQFKALAFLMAAVPAILGGYLGGLLAGNLVSRMFLQRSYRSHKDYQRYVAFRKAERGFEENFARERRAYWQRLDGSQFERRIINVLKRSNYDVRVIPASSGIGSELLIGKDTKLLCTNQRSPVKVEAVRNLYSSLQYGKICKAVFISLSGFTHDCKKEVQTRPVKLWDINQIIRLERRLQN